LEKSFRVIYFEPRGNGQSSQPPDDIMSSRVMAEDIEHLRRHLGLSSLPVLLGHSNGAGIALRYAEQHPDRVDKLVLIDSEIQDVHTTVWQGWAEKRKDDPDYAGAIAGFKRRRADPPQTDEEFAKMMDVILPWYFSDLSFLPCLVEDIEGKTYPPLVYAFLRNHRQDMIEGNGSAHLEDGHKVRAKRLIVWGEEDPITSVEAGRKVAEVIPGCKMVTFEGCGHFPWIERREEFWRVADEFVKG
ncbi:Alpha/Beta hydrolase protein, partial [Coniochaeta sp. 2T2.1]